jgi:hypothetical protein
MWHQENKLTEASVISGFESQDDAEDAVLGLRMLGFQDIEIGYFFADSQGQMKDYLARYHRFSGAVVGTVIGAVIGWVCARLVYSAGHDLDPFGLAMSAGVTSAFFFGMLGGLTGLWCWSPREEALVPKNFTEPYVVTVKAGNKRDDVWAMIRKYGGHELLPQEFIVPCKEGDVVQV